MGSNSNIDINAAYVATWKAKNPNLFDLNVKDHFLIYQNEKIDISEIYMQDILINPNLFQSIYFIESKDLFTIIKLHIDAIKIKERTLKEKVRRRKEYDYQYAK